MDDDKPARRPRTRGNRDGRPYQRADGRWVCVVWPPPEIGGKPRYLYAKTAKEARAKREKLLEEYARTVPGAAGRDTTLARYMEHWLGVTLPQELAAGNMAPSTLDSYQANVRLHILPDLGTITLRNLTAPRIRQWQHDLLTKPSARTRKKGAPAGAPVLSARTVTYCRQILHKAIGDAVRDQVWGIRANVVDLVKPPKKKAAEVEPPDMDEAAALLAAAAEDKWSALWLVILGLGLRRGEALGLRWADIDFANQTLQVREIVQRVRGAADPVTGKRSSRLVTKPPKTDASKRTLAVPETVVEELRAWRRHQHQMRVAAPVWLAEDLVFTTSVGTAIEPRNVNRQWRKVCQAAGVERPVVPHALRHAWGTYLMARGVDVKTISAGYGHTQLSTTQRYLHAMEEVARDAAQVMDSVLVDLRGRAPRRRSS